MSACRIHKLLAPCWHWLPVGRKWLNTSETKRGLSTLEFPSSDIFVSASHGHGRAWHLLRFLTEMLIVRWFMKRFQETNTYFSRFLALLCRTCWFAHFVNSRFPSYAEHKEVKNKHDFDFLAHRSKPPCKEGYSFFLVDLSHNGCVIDRKFCPVRDNVVATFMPRLNVIFIYLATHKGCPFPMVSARKVATWMCFRSVLYSWSNIHFTSLGQWWG